jgi:hypothetical protein
VASSDRAGTGRDVGEETYDLPPDDTAESGPDAATVSPGSLSLVTASVWVSAASQGGAEPTALRRRSLACNATHAPRYSIFFGAGMVWGCPK